jgi:hypothetical protein
MFLLFAAAAFLVPPSIGWAQGAVALKVQVIRAADQPGGVDPRLQALVRDLEKGGFKFSMYKLLDTPQGSVGLNQTWRTALPENRSLEVVPTAIQSGQHDLTVRVLGPTGQGLLNTKVRLRSAGAPVVVGVPLQPGVLILAISAN